MNLHLNYEQVPVCEDVDVQYHGLPDYRVNKMKFAKRRNADGKLEKYSNGQKYIFNLLYENN